MTEESTRPPLAPGDWDGFSRAESLRRLLLLSERPPIPAPRPTLIARLRAAWASWVAFWRHHR